MSFDRATLTNLMSKSLTEPRLTFRRILASGSGLSVSLSALVLVAVLSALISSLFSLISSPLGNPEMDRLLAQPLRLAALQLLGMGIIAGLITGLGRLFGGTGRFDQAVLLVAWLEFLMIALQLALILVMLALPGLGGLLLLLCGGLVLWLFANAVAELHGFQSALTTLAAVLGFVMLIGVLLTLILPAQ